MIINNNEVNMTGRAHNDRTVSATKIVDRTSSPTTYTPTMSAGSSNQPNCKLGEPVHTYRDAPDEPNAASGCERVLYKLLLLMDESDDLRRYAYERLNPIIAPNAEPRKTKDSCEPSPGDHASEVFCLMLERLASIEYNIVEIKKSIQSVDL